LLLNRNPVDEGELAKKRSRQSGLHCSSVLARAGLQKLEFVQLDGIHTHLIEGVF
jgi:hypothetical protein